MTLPETIPVRYTEEEAGYVSFRPLVRQIFRLNELLDMVVSVTGKDQERIRQICAPAPSSSTSIATGGKASRSAKRS